MVKPNNAGSGLYFMRVNTAVAISRALKVDKKEVFFAL
jgi:hypothetical protein